VTCGDGALTIWNVSSGEVLRVISPRFVPPGGSALRESFRRVEMFPNGDRLLTWGRQSWATIFDIATAAVVCDLHGHNFPINAARVFPVGDRVITGSIDGFAIIWNVSSCSSLTRLHHTEGVMGVEVLGVGETVATLSSLGATVVWTAASGQRRHVLVFQTPRFAEIVLGMRVFPDGERLLTFDSEVATVWNTTTGGALRRLHTSPTYLGDIAVSPDGELIVTCGSDEVTIWNATSGAVLWSHDEASVGPPTAASLDSCFVGMGLTTALDPRGLGGGLSWRKLPRMWPVLGAP